MWTLVGAGQKNLDQSGKPMSSVLPSNADWIKEKAAKIDAENSTVTVESGEEIKYEYLVISVGLQLDYNKVPI